MKTTSIFRFVIAVILAGVIGDFVHIVYGHFIGSVAIYNSYITTVSFFTKPFEALGVGIVYYLLGDRLYFKSAILRALLLTVIICLIKDGFIRQPIMNILIGNSFVDSLLRESQVWLASFAMSLVITILIVPRNYISRKVGKY